ncbi:transposase, partial [Limosilactobacillus caviae]|uniref:transposase n=1 Tax=Limosilactobacillus caviae TaxID=1769424 RepID=UPI001E50C33F
QSFIYRLFPNARIIIDRFHIVQLVGRALNNCRVNILKLLDKHTREYKLLKSQWKLFHLKATELQPEKPVYLRGINEYMTKQNAVDLVLNQFPQFSAVYNAYQEITAALHERNSERLITILSQYQNTGTEMDT